MGCDIMKSIRKSIVICLIFSLFISLIACGNSENTSDGETEKILDENKYYISMFDMDEDLLNEIKSKKNKDVEVPYSESGYSEDELSELILSTNAFMSISFDDGSHMCYSFNGNIYDIDDDYIYILTCGHGFVKTSEDYGKKDFSDVLKYVKIRFVTGEVIEGNPKYIYVSENNDVAIILLDKNLVSNNTMEVLHSINISKMYTKNLTNTSIYEYAYNYENKCYEKYYANVIGTRYDKLQVETNAINGCSGGGFFDIHGTYSGMTYNNGHLLYDKVITDFYELIKEMNPNY